MIEQPHFEYDIPYMKQAYALALKAADLGEVPIGAIVVDPHGKSIGFGYNKTETEQCQNAHAEAMAIKSACESLHDWRLDGCSLYVTLQPCMICYGLCALSRVERMVYGAPSPVYGFHIDTADLPAVYTKHMKFFSSGVMSDEIEALLKGFFSARRG